VYTEHTPDERVEDFCALLTAFLGEIPVGELDLRQASWTKERLREVEDRAIAIGRVKVFGFAVAPDGHLCGFNDLGINRDDPGHASVGPSCCPSTGVTGSGWP
jgi:hypothetical protein